MDLLFSLCMVTAVIAVITGMVFVALKLMNKDGNATTKYDERQKRVRGEAYKYAFFSVIISNGILMLTNIFGTAIESFGYNIFFIPIFVGIVVHISICIFKDAYIGLNTNITKFMIFMFLISLLNLGLAARAIVMNELIVDGKFQPPFLNLMCGSIFIVLGFELLIKMLIDKKEA